MNKIFMSPLLIPSQIPTSSPFSLLFIFFNVEILWDVQITCGSDGKLYNNGCQMRRKNCGKLVYEVGRCMKLKGLCHQLNIFLKAYNMKSVLSFANSFYIFSLLSSREKSIWRFCLLLWKRLLIIKVVHNSQLVSDFIEANGNFILDFLHKKTTENCENLKRSFKKYCFEF